MKQFEVREQCYLNQGLFDERFTLKGTSEFYSPDHPLKSKHVLLDLKVDIKNQTVKGHCQTILQVINETEDHVYFNAVDFVVERVLWNGQKTSFTHKKGKLAVKSKTRLQAGEDVTIDVYYRIHKPKLGIYFLKPDRHYPNRPTQVWTQGQDEYARYWFPCHDTPGVRITSEMVATVPSGFTAVSNGKLVKTVQNKKDKTTLFHYKQNIPHSPYLVTLTVGQFSLIKDNWKKVPVQYFCEKGRELEAKRAFAKTPKMIEFFSKSIGVPYPYEKYAQVAVSDFI